MFSKLILAIFILSLGGCMSFGDSEEKQQVALGERSVAYSSGNDNTSLTIPPDLTKPKITEAVPLPSNVNSEPIRILLPPEDITVEKRGQRRWLVVNKKPEDIWSLVKDFLKEYGFSIKKSDRKIGMIETDVLPRADEIPDQALGTIRSGLRSLLKTRYSLPVVDKYRVRIEPIDNGQKSEIYLSLTSLEEVLKNEGQKSEAKIWQSHPKDYELEAEMLYRLMTFLGSDEAKAQEKFLEAKDKQSIKVILAQNENGYAKLVFPLDEIETWKSVGWAFDELDIDIEDKDPKERSFYLGMARTADKGFFSRVFGEDAIKKTFQILVRKSGADATEVYFNDLSEENEKETIDFSHEFFEKIAKLF